MPEERTEDADLEKFRVRRTMGAGTWALMGYAAKGNGVAQPPDPVCVHGFRLTVAASLCGCAEGAPDA